jgi:nitrate/nitrite transporter NarK
VATDYCTRRLGLKWGRCLLGVGSQWLAALGVAAGLLAHDPVLATLGFAFVWFATDLGLGAVWAYFQDAGGSYVATFLGCANMFGNLGGFVSPLAFGLLAQYYGWTPALLVSLGLFILAGFFWFAVDPRVSILPQEPGGAST